MADHKAKAMALLSRCGYARGGPISRTKRREPDQKSEPRADDMPSPSAPQKDDGESDTPENRTYLGRLRRGRLFGSDSEMDYGMIKGPADRWDSGDTDRKLERDLPEDDGASPWIYASGGAVRQTVRSKRRG